MTIKAASPMDCHAGESRVRVHKHNKVDAMGNAIQFVEIIFKRPALVVGVTAQPLGFSLVIACDLTARSVYRRLMTYRQYISVRGKNAGRDRLTVQRAMTMPR